MFVVNGQSISITKGDTGTFTITFTGDDKPDDGTTVLVTLKKRKGDNEPVWEKELTVADSAVTVSLAIEDTNLDFGTYWWDARILFSSEDVYTPMNPASFKILEVVGDVE